MEIMNYELLAEMGIYIQKSKTFIWPLLNIKAFPIETYLKFGTLTAPDERLLIALFHNENEHYKKHLSEIKDNEYYDFTFTDDEFDIVTFNMNKIKNDYDKIVNGQYSKLSDNFKLFISVTEKNKIVTKCLEPVSNYREFARTLGIADFELEGKELLSPPNDQAETIFVNSKIKNEIIESYGLVEKV
jgi:hypothetical protein